MLLELLNEFNDVDHLSEQEQFEIMPVSSSGEGSNVERLLRKIFLFAIKNFASDVHISGKGHRDRPTVVISIKTPTGGFINYTYTGRDSAHFRKKLFDLTGTPQGGTTPDTNDARFSIDLPGQYAEKLGLPLKHFPTYAVDFRVAYTKTFDGFAFVCRLLDQQRTPELMDMHLPYALLRSLLRAISQPSGLFLVSGPTGSGKSTLLNAIIQHLNEGQVAIHTIEDPVEFRIRGDGPIKQVAVGGSITFASGLRTALRMAPGLILVGEIRDQETMRLAIEASRTGHLVFATIHANSAAETITRALGLLPSGDAFSLSDVLKFVIAQRRIERYQGRAVHRLLNAEEKDWLQINGIPLPTNNGLPEVVNGDPAGRISIHEAIVIDNNIKKAIRKTSVDTHEIYRFASEQWQYETLAMAGIRAMETRGCRLSDCMNQLETTSAAQEHQGTRIRLSIKHNVSLANVAQLIDEYLLTLDSQDADGPEPNLDEIFESRK